MNVAYQYKDVCLLPRYSSLKTRQRAEVSTTFLGKDFKLPVVPSNMRCVINEEHAQWLSEHGYFYVMHRFGVDALEFVRAAQSWKTVSISVGVQETDKYLLEQIVAEDLRLDYVTIDIAHGDSILMKEMLGHISTLALGARIIAGNVCTPEGYRRLVEWGADAVKVGIGGGGVCSTKNKTGFTFPMYSCISHIERVRELDDPPIVADGGVREHADIVKAIHAGAEMVMIGGLFSRCIDSPAELLDGQKVYFGSASQYNKGEYRNVEGVKRTLDLDTMTYAEKLIEIEQDLQSAVSYAGGRNLLDIASAEALRVTSWEA
jgi:GMP reductase